MPAAAPARGHVLVSPQPRSLPGLERAKQRLDSALPAPSPRRAAAPRTQPIGPGVFSGLAATSNADWAGFTPSDSTGAIGPSNYVELVNSQIGIYDTDGNLVTGFPQDLQTFLFDKGLTSLTKGTSRADPGDQIFDVQVQWDQHWNRWLIASDDVLPSGDARLVFGWSTTTDPAGDWCLYTTDPGAEFDDFPKLGHDDDFLLIGTNVFTDTSPSGTYDPPAHVWAISKTDPTNTSDLTCDTSRPALAQLALSGTDFTPVPANIAGDSTTGYVVATTFTGLDDMRLYKITNNAGTPQISGPTSIPVAPWGPPPNVQQPGTTNVIDSQDGRLTQAVATTDPGTGDETIWTQHTVASADGRRAEVRWYELDGDAGTKLQEGSIADPSNSVFNAAISPTKDDSQAAIDYDVGGRFHLVQARAQTRVDGTTPANTMENEITLGSSAAVDADFTCTQDPQCRWGDYAGASPDPSDATRVWGTNQLSGPSPPADPAAPSWTTINFAPTSGGPDLPPDTTADGFPFTSASPTPVFDFASSETGSTFQCSVDGGAFAACTPGTTFGPPLPNGTHDFGVRAIDAAGQTDPTPAHGGFTIAAPTPDTAIDSAPPATTTSRSVAYTFHASIPNPTFQCSIDGQAWFTCASPFRTPVLPIGAHDFAVRAVDALGNVDPTPAANGFGIVPEPKVTMSARRQRASRRWIVSVRVHCPASRTASCVGSVTLTSGRLKLGSARFRVRHGRTATVHVKLGRRARAQLKRRRRLKAKATFRISSPEQRTMRTFTLLRPRRS
jgi:hypothetical protein